MAVRDTLVELGGQERRLRWTLAAWAAVEDYGYTVSSILEGLVGAVSEDGSKSPPKMKAVAVCCWAMLQGENPAPSLREVMGWIDLENFATVISKMGDCIRVGSPPGNPPPAAPPSP